MNMFFISLILFSQYSYTYIYKIIHLEKNGKNIVLLYDDHGFGTETENLEQMEQFKEVLNSKASKIVLLEGYFDSQNEKAMTVKIDEKFYESTDIRSYYEIDNEIKSVCLKYSSYVEHNDKTWIWSSLFKILLQDNNIPHIGCDPRFKYEVLHENFCQNTDFKEDNILAMYISLMDACRYSLLQMLPSIENNIELTEMLIKIDEARNVKDFITRFLEQIKKGYIEAIEFINNSYSDNFLAYIFDHELLIHTAGLNEASWVFVPVGGAHAKHLAECLISLGFNIIKEYGLEEITSEIRNKLGKVLRNESIQSYLSIKDSDYVLFEKLEQILIDVKNGFDYLKQNN